MYNYEGLELEAFLIKATQVETVRKHAIMFLAMMQSQRAVAHFIYLFHMGCLKKHIINALDEYENFLLFPF